MAGNDDIDFHAHMRDRGVKRAGHEETERAGPPEGASTAELRATIDGLTVAVRGARVLREQARKALAAEQAEHAHTQATLEATTVERDEARTAVEATLVERDRAREALARMQAERDALAKERKALLRRQQMAAEPKAAAAPVEPTLREALAERGIDEQNEAAELLLALLDRDPAPLLGGLRVTPALIERALDRLALVCERSECQPDLEQAVVVRVPAERCEVCGGSDIKVAFDLLLRAARRAGVTRLVIVGGSPPYRTQLRELSRGTDLKLDLVSGRSKPGKKRARNDAERVVIWAATILDHGTSAAYEHLGDRLIRVAHRGISRMLREVALALE